jgi:hypothetical protein
MTILAGEIDEAITLGTVLPATWAVRSASQGMSGPPGSSTSLPAQRRMRELAAMAGSPSSCVMLIRTQENTGASHPRRSPMISRNSKKAG